MLESEQFMESEDEVEELYDNDDDGDGDGDGDGDVDSEPGADGLVGVTPGADDATEDGDDTSSDESEEEEEELEEEEEEEEEEEDEEPLLDLGLTDEGLNPPQSETMRSRSPSVSPTKAATPQRKRSLTPSQIRRNGLSFALKHKSPRTFIVEAICAIPHPVPTHSLASSACMLHLLTGSDDGYIRDYDIFSAVNGKNFLTAPQRHHANVVEGLMKSGQLRSWWENPASAEALRLNGTQGIELDDSGLAPVYSLAMQSDALWALAGSNAGFINLFTVRHDPGRLAHVMTGHRGPISSLCLDYDEKAFFSAGWDGEAIQWDLNTGQTVRHFTSHGAQLTGIAIRPSSTNYVQQGPAVMYQFDSKADGDVSMGSPALNEAPVTEAGDVSMNSAPDDLTNNTQPASAPSPAKSDASFDPLFDDEPEDNGGQTNNGPLESKLAIPGGTSTVSRPAAVRTAPSLHVPKGAPPLLDPVSYSHFSPELLMTASIDGQVILWDRRVQTANQGVGRLWMSEKTPPFCLSACWSADGSQIYAGRRNGTVDIWDVRLLGLSGPSQTPRLLKTLRNPQSSGVVSCVVAFPDSRHLACASVDNIRLWNVADSPDESSGKPKGGVQFKIIPGHHGGYISQMLVDPGCRFLVSASSNRGWHGDSTRTVFVHDIKYI